MRRIIYNFFLSDIIFILFISELFKECLFVIEYFDVVYNYFCSWEKNDKLWFVNDTFLVL